MKFTIALVDLKFLMKGAGVSRPTTRDTITLSACAARVFVHSKNGIAGIEAMVFRDGAVTLPAKTFSALLKTYKGTKFLNFEAARPQLQINNLVMPVLGYDPAPSPPADFQVFSAKAAPTSHQNLYTQLRGLR